MVQSFMGLIGPSGVLPRHYTELALSPGEGPEQAEPGEACPARLARPLQSSPGLPVLPGLGEVSLLRPVRAGEATASRARPLHRLPVQPGGAGHAVLTESPARFGPGDAGGRRSQEHLLARVENLALLRYSGLLAQPGAIGGRACRRCSRTTSGFPSRLCSTRANGFRSSRGTERRSRTDGNNQLGFTAVIGERVWDIQSKFRLRLGPLDYHQFLEFLPDRSPVPDRKALFLLVHMVKLYVGIGLDFDVQLVLRSAEVPDCQLEEDSHFGARLGWNTWLRSQPLDRDPDDTVFEGKEVIWIPRHGGERTGDQAA